MPSLDSVVFESAGLALEGDLEGVRVWRTTDGDAVGLYYFPIPPDIGAPLESIDALRRFYVSVVEPPVSPIYLDLLELDGCPALRLIARVPQQPEGMTYLGSITLPFRDFSFVFKAQCEEHGITGIRDNVVFGQFLRSGLDRLWRIQPDEPLGLAALPRNRAEEESYDEQFPTHPLSRLRRILHLIEASVQVEPDVRGLAPFVYQERRPRRWRHRS